MLLILEGNDTESKKLEISQIATNTQLEQTNDIATASISALTPSLFYPNKTVVLNSEINKDFPILETAKGITLILNTTKADKRLKATKELLKIATLKCFKLPTQWDDKALEKLVKDSLKYHDLTLSNAAIKHIAKAISTKPETLQKQLKKLAALSNNPKHTEITATIPDHSQTTLDLANAIINNDKKTISELTKKLLRTIHPNAITATIKTQLRTWMLTAIAVESGKTSNNDIANLLDLKNPNRAYYLKKEVQDSTSKQLLQALTAVLNLNYNTNLELELLLIADKLAN